MAADSMTTESAPLGAGAITKHETGDKLVLQHELIWGASGSVGIKQIVQEEIEKHYRDIIKPPVSPVELRSRLVKVIHPVLKAQYQLVADITNNPQLIPWTNLVFGVRLQNEFHLLNIEANCAGEVVVDSKHFATGSAQKTGQALLGRLRNQKWDVATALVVAYRTMNDAIHVEPGGIGPPIRLARYFVKDGQPKIEKIEVDSPEYNGIRDTARIWTDLERDDLENLKAEKDNTEAGAPPADIPKP
jgi:hypothetical protein